MCHLDITSFEEKSLLSNTRPDNKRTVSQYVNYSYVYYLHLYGSTTDPKTPTKLNTRIFRRLTYIDDYKSWKSRF